MTYVAVENATGDLYIVHVDKLDPYRVLARDVLKNWPTPTIRTSIPATWTSTCTNCRCRQLATGQRS